MVRLLASATQIGGYTKNNIQNSLGIVRVLGGSFWSHQRPSAVYEYDEPHTCWFLGPFHCGVPWWFADLLEDTKGPCRTSETSTTKTTGPQTVCKSIQVPDCPQDDRVPRTTSDTKRIMPHWSEVGSCLQLEGAPKCEGCLLIPRIRQILLEARTPICRSSTPINRIDEKGRGVAMGASPAIVFPRIENQIMHNTNIAVP